MLINLAFEETGDINPNHTGIQEEGQEDYVTH
jgi:hypothetical protein